MIKAFFGSKLLGILFSDVAHPGSAAHSTALLQYAAEQSQSAAATAVHMYHHHTSRTFNPSTTRLSVQFELC